MIDLSEIGVVATSLKTAIDMAKATLGLRDAELVQGKVFELQRVIIEAQKAVLAAQAERAALIEEVAGLKTELAQFEGWEREKKKYQLVDVGTGAFAYARKKTVSPLEPEHHICANCYQQRRKSILHKTASRYERTLDCHACGQSIALAL